MANPNIVSVTSIKGESVGFNLSATTTTTLMTVASNKVVKVNRITVANVDGTNAADVTVSITKANFTPDGISDFDTSGTFFIAKTISVPADSTLVLLDTPIYLMESDVLKGGAGAASDLDLFVSYESIDDA
mgnify:FL=1|jgi:hypothetical protein|tara:strand:- start:213 stop:605 length:393 start_codon:yes stop_codon:yes gene_type:complete